MQQLNQIITTLQQHKVEVIEKYKVKELGIFGSYVRNEQNEHSDTDILVEFQEPVSLFDFMDLENYLEQIIHNKVDLVSKKALKPYIGQYILKEVIYI